MDVRIRDLPDDLHRDLKVAAAIDGKTINAEIVDILTAAMAKRRPGRS
jgi:plasmid stability protein